MFERLERFATGRRVRWALLLFLAMLLVMNLAAAHFYAATGGHGILDLGGGRSVLDDRGGYTPEQAYALIGAYGAAGIRHYYRLLLADAFFPPLLGGFCILALVWIGPRLLPGRRWWRWLLLLPLLYVCADWAENAGILTMLLHYPQRLSAVAELTNLARAAKGATADASLLLVAAGWLALHLRPARRR